MSSNEVTWKDKLKEMCIRDRLMTIHPQRYPHRQCDLDRPFNVMTGTSSVSEAREMCCLPSITRRS